MTANRKTRIKKPPVFPKNRIKELRKERGLTQEELAEKIGTTTQTVGRWENRTVSISIQRLNEIASALGVSSGDILETGESSLSQKEKALIDNFRHLTPEQQDALCALGVSMAQPIKKDKTG